MNGSTASRGKAPSTQTALVIGGGIAGIQAALDIAEAGFKVHLIERESSIGGRMSQLDKTFPTLDCSSCILTPRMADITRNQNITLHTGTEVVKTTRQAGGFQIKLEQKPRYVDVESCTGCGSCVEACPVEVADEFNAGLNTHKAIYRRFPQAVPAAFVIEKRPSPCKVACPAHIPVQGYISLIAQGKYQEAVTRIREAGVPFVGTLGRVCYHPCEEICKRSEWDEPVSICGLKRFAYDASASTEALPPSLPITRNEKVAIIGAGPAGLTAAYALRREGYQTTIFEALPVAGGMLAAGIPAYRLPREVLNHEIDFIRALGVEIKLNTPVGGPSGPSLEDLRREYQAVFVAIGAQGSSLLGIPGEDLTGVLQAVPFLRRLNLEGVGQVGKHVAVIGGGNSAIDAARCALRLGAEVHVLYRRSRAEMPAASYEVAAAEAEGVKLNYLVAPLRVLEGDGRAAGIECTRMELGEPDASGRRRPVPIHGSEFSISVDTVIAAIGQTVESEGLSVEIERSRLVADPLTLQTPLRGVFAGGDATLGPASVIEAIAAGMQAANSIQRHLCGLELISNGRNSWPKPESILVKPPRPVRQAKRESMVEIPPDERIAGFQEVEMGLSEKQAADEAQRCLACAVCSECLQCVAVCQRGAIQHNDQLRQVEVSAQAIIVATGFDLFDPLLKPEFGYGIYPEVITSLEFERLVSASGPTAGKILLNGKAPRKVVFIQCVGSRDQSLDIPNCSRVCCMAVAKQAHLAHERLPEASISVFYMDVRAFGKGFEEFYDRVRKEGILYRRGNPAEILRRKDILVVRAEDTLLGELVEVEADLVILAVGMQPHRSMPDLGSILGLELDEAGYFQEAHPNLQTVESNIDGIYLAGCCQGPKDIPDTVAQAKAAASAVLIRLAKRQED